MCISHPRETFSVYIHYPSAVEYFGANKVSAEPIRVIKVIHYNRFTTFEKIRKIVEEHLNVDHHKKSHYAAVYYTESDNSEWGNLRELAKDKMKVRDWVKKNGQAELHIRFEDLIKKTFFPHAVHILFDQIPVGKTYPRPLFQPYIADM